MESNVPLTLDEIRALMFATEFGIPAATALMRDNPWDDGYGSPLESDSLRDSMETAITKLRRSASDMAE